MLIPIKIGKSPQARVQLLGGGEKLLVPGQTITVRTRELGSEQTSLVVDAVERFSNGKLKVVLASPGESGL